jgi:hypothetical protein
LNEPGSSVQDADSWCKAIALINHSPTITQLYEL